MFQSFTQADNSTTRKYGGTGLGLSISKTLSEMLGGRIWVETEAGKGSTFHFTAHLEVQAQPVARRMIHAQELNGVRLLVVDDNATAREIIMTMAGSFGMEVQAASSSPQAIEMITQTDDGAAPYDLILMDWKMPVMDGIECAKHLQAMPLKHEPAIIMLTAYSREEALELAEERDVQLKTVLTKPVTPSTLLESIASALDKGVVVQSRAREKADQNMEAKLKLRGARVLLVEDNEMNQELALELLGDAGMTVVVANNGKEALDMLATDPSFDGILMDCQMPVMDGYTATRELRKIPAFASMPIIAMTANAMAGDRERAIESGMNDHIAKPIDVDRMYSTLAHWIKTTGQSSDPQPPQPVQAQAQTSDSGRDTLLEAAGIDARAGLATCAGNENLYGRMLRRFHEGQRDFAEMFRHAQQDSDPQAATRAAHTLKGTAGNIGAKKVQSAAEQLEQVCRNGDVAQIGTALEATLQALHPVITALGTLPEATVPPPSPPRPDIGKARFLLKTLEGLLAESDAESVDTAAQLSAALHGTPHQHAADTLAQDIAKFEFDDALEAVEQLQHELDQGRTS